MCITINGKFTPYQCPEGPTASVPQFQGRHKATFNPIRSSVSHSWEGCGGGGVGTERTPPIPEVRWMDRGMYSMHHQYMSSLYILINLIVDRDHIKMKMKSLGARHDEKLSMG